jgi:hypothetical protein
MKEIKCGSITVTFLQHDAEIHFKPKRFVFKVPKIKNWALLETTLEALPNEKDREHLMGGFLYEMFQTVIREDLLPLRS